MDANSNEIGERLTRIILDLLCLWRIGPEYRWNVYTGILEDRVRRGNRANVAAGTGVWHPRCRRVLARGCQHIELCIGWRRCRGVEKRRGPVSEGNSKIACAIRVEIAEAVTDWYTVTIAVDTCQRCQNIGCRMCDQRCVMIGEQHPVIRHKVQQVWHLLKVRRDMWIIAHKMYVVELDIDYMLDVALGRVELTGVVACRVSRRPGSVSREPQEHDQHCCHGNKSSDRVPPKSFCTIHRISSPR